jgi:tetratricopeptide (TPR) repeat protein
VGRDVPRLAGHGPLGQAVHLIQVTWRFWWLRGHAAELARPGDDFVAGSKDMPPYQHALALTQAGFIIVANGDRARAGQLFEQALPLFGQDNDRPAASVTMNALVLAVLGYLAALRRDYAAASRLLDQGQALLRELRDDDFSGYDRLQQQVTVAFVNNALGQVRLGQGDNDAAAQLFTDGLAVARRAQDWNPLLVLLYDLALARQAQATWPTRRGICRRGWR